MLKRIKIWGVEYLSGSHPTCDDGCSVIVDERALTISTQCGIFGIRAETEERLHWWMMQHGLQHPDWEH